MPGRCAPWPVNMKARPPSAATSLVTAGSCRPRASRPRPASSSSRSPPRSTARWSSLARRPRGAARSAAGQVGVPRAVSAQGVGLGPQRPCRRGRQGHRHRYGRRGRRSLPGRVGPGGGGGGGGARRLLQDDVRVDAADAEAGHRGPARPAVLGRGPGRLLGQQADRPGGPVDVRRGLVHVQGARAATPCRMASTILIMPADAAGRLRVPDVRLQRAEQERAPVGPAAAVGVLQACGLDRVAERRAGPVRLHHVDVGRAPGPRRPAPRRMTPAAPGRSGR